MKLIAKKIFPKRILSRLLLIFFIPLICIQCLAVFLFYDRHWEKITTRFANIASNQVNLIIEDFEKTGILNDKIIRGLNLNVELIDEKIEFKVKKPKGLIEKNIIKTLNTRINKKYNIEFKKNSVSISVYLKENIIRISLPKKYLVSETPLILFLWIIISSVILSLVAFLFMRIQVRAITRLAKFSNEVGTTLNSKRFKPEGAVEIRVAGNAVLKMKKRIDNQLKDQTYFLAGISHDLGTIITRMKLQLELITNLSDIKDIKNDINAMQVLLNEYLEYTKNIDTSEKVKSINIKKFLGNLIIDSKKNFPRTTINIKCNYKINIIYSETNLYRVFSNILNNACKFAKEVSIEVQITNKNKLFINFEDNGPGVPEKMKNKIFRPFFKLDSSRNLNYPGSGLGLSIAKDIVAKMGGSINLTESKKGGCCFSVVLPYKIG